MACKPKSCKNSLINVGNLNKRIAFQSVTQTSDGAGGYTEEWATILTAWASIEPVKAYEKFVAMQTETHISHKITCRYNPLITTAKRAVIDGRILDIIGVMNVNEQNVAMSITAMEGTL